MIYPKLCTVQGLCWCDVSGHIELVTRGMQLGKGWLRDAAHHGWYHHPFLTFRDPS